MTPLRLAALAVVSAVLALGCSGSLAPDLTLEGRTFLSVKVSVAGADRPLVPGTRIRLSFDNGSLRAAAGCNSMGSTYRLEGDRLWVEGGAMTQMGCDPGRHAQDEWLSGLLASGPTAQLTGNNLVLAAGDTIIQLVDRRIAEPDRPLTGTLWTVDSISQRAGVSSAPIGVVATILIAADGRLTVDTGCNTGGGAITITGATVEFVELIATDAAACGGGADVMERAVLAVLGAETITYTIEADRLTLLAGDVGLGLRAPAGP